MTPKEPQAPLNPDLPINDPDGIENDDPMDQLIVMMLETIGIHKLIEILVKKNEAQIRSLHDFEKLIGSEPLSGERASAAMREIKRIEQG